METGLVGLPWWSKLPGLTLSVNCREHSLLFCFSHSRVLPLGEVKHSISPWLLYSEQQVKPLTSPGRACSLPFWYLPLQKRVGPEDPGLSGLMVFPRGRTSRNTPA